MRKYLSTLHEKSPLHKKRFALLASSVMTLFIFGIWSLVTFGTSGKLTNHNNTQALLANSESEVGPLESLRMGVSTSFELLYGNLRALTSNIGNLDIGKEYQEMRDGALETYGR